MGPTIYYSEKYLKNFRNECNKKKSNNETAKNYKSYNIGFLKDNNFKFKKSFKKSKNTI